MLAGLTIVWAALRWQNVIALGSERTEPEFEDEPADRMVTLEVWDSRVGSASGGRRVNDAV